MEIKYIEISSLKIPLNRTFKTAIRTTDFLEDLMITVKTDEYVGYGCAPAATAITGDTIDAMYAAMENLVIPKLKGMDALDRLAIQQTIFSKMEKNYGVKMAVDMALFDLAAKAANLPLYRYLGASNQALTTDVTISRGTQDEIKKNVEQALSKGFKILKIKLGNQIQEDIAACKMLATLLPKNIIVRLDANQAWNSEETLFFLNAILKINLNIELIEQPVNANDLKSMAIITAHSKWPILADESVFDDKDTLKCLETKAANLINIKLAKCGGIANAMRIKHIADAFGVECMLGCMMESPLGIAAAAHFALATGITKVDLDPLDWVSADWYSSWLKFNKGEIILTDNPGLGFEPQG